MSNETDFKSALFEPKVQKGLMLMAQIVCNDCKQSFDEEELTQCPYCNAPIGIIKVIKSVKQADNTLTNMLIAERLAPVLQVVLRIC